MLSGGPSAAGLGALERLAELAATARDLPSLFERGARELLALFRADGLSIYLVAPGSEQLEVAYRVGVTPGEAELYDSVPVKSTIAWNMIHDRRPRSFAVDSAYADAVREQVCQAGFLAGASVPLEIHSRAIGCVTLGFRQLRTLSEDELWLLQLLSGHFAAAIEGHRLLAQERAVSQTNAHLYEELRATNAALVQMQARLSEKERMASLGEMASVLAHEIRNPLGVLSNGLSLLRLKAGQAPDPRVLTAMGQEVERMNALATDLLDFARPLKLERTVQPLPPLLEDVASAAGREMPIALEWTEDLNLVEVDARRLRQALLNVATNAVQAAGARGQVWMRARALGGEVYIEVDDTGPGIPAELQQRVFEPFFTTKATGTGLGLPLAKRIVELHDGRIELDSRPGGAGTRVRIALPSPQP